MIRLHGVLHRVEGPHLRAEDTEELMQSITSEDHIQQVRERGGADFGFAFGEAARFRVSVFKERGNFGLVLRQIPTKLLTVTTVGPKGPSPLRCSTKRPPAISGTCCRHLRAAASRSTPSGSSSRICLTLSAITVALRCG